MFVGHLGLLADIFISTVSTPVVLACLSLCMCVFACAPPQRDYCVGQSAEEPSSIYWVPQSPLGHTVHTHKRTDTSPSLDPHLSSQTRDSPQTH